MQKRNFKFQIYVLLLLFLTLYALHQVPSGNLAFRFSLPVFAQSSTPPSNQVNYRSEASVDIAVGNPPISTSSKGHLATNNTCDAYKTSSDKFFRDLYIRYQADFLNNVDFSPKNFGDPICDYTLNGLASLIHQTDPKHEYCWYNVIVPNESGYDPNAEQLNDPYDPNHAWGNFQMGRTGQAGSDDYGNVDWQTQFFNAFHHNERDGESFHYWSTRRYDPAACQPNPQ